jgi:hypothetical protein
MGGAWRSEGPHAQNRPNSGSLECHHCPPEGPGGAVVCWLPRKAHMIDWTCVGEPESPGRPACHYLVMSSDEPTNDDYSAHNLAYPYTVNQGFTLHAPLTDAVL